MSEYRVLDLFCGLGGFSQAFVKSDRWEVTTVDIADRFEPDIVADVFELRPSDFDQEFDVVLASPPCTRLGKMALCQGYFDNGRPQTDEAADHVGLLYHTLGIIKGVSPRYWFVENPPGRARAYLGDPTGTVTYCQYGRDDQKRTHLWGDHPPMQYRSCSEGDGCHVTKTHTEHPNESIPSDPQQAAKVPTELSEAIRDACEAGLDGEAPEQATLGEVSA